LPAIALLFTVASVVVADSPQPACSLADCLKRLASIVRVETVSPPSAELVGTWSFGGGLGGSFLYLFEDQTYIFTEWADIMPETVYHKGTWQVDDRVLTLAVDPDVTWDRPGDYRFLVYQVKGAAAARLLGLDRMLGFLEQSIRQLPGNNDLALKAASFNRRSGWRPGESVSHKADIMKKCWKPDYFADSK
jgi:hypothetical protein